MELQGGAREAEANEFASTPLFGEIVVCESAHVVDDERNLEVEPFGDVSYATLADLADDERDSGAARLAHRRKSCRPD